MLTGSCRKITEQASDYLDRDMPVFKRIKIRLHLLMCVHCRKFMRQFEVTVGVIKKLHPRKSDVSDRQVEEQVKTIMGKTRK